MSEYHTCKTAIKVEDQDFLREAIKRAAKELWGKTLRNEDIEFHQQATNLIGYQNDIRDQLANVIIRRRNLPSLWNDFGFVDDGSGNYQAIEQEFQRDEVKRFVSLVKANVSSLKVEEAIKEIKEKKPDSKVYVAGEEVPIDQLAYKVQSYFVKGEAPPVKISVRKATPKTLQQQLGSLSSTPQSETEVKGKMKPKKRHKEFE